MVWRAVVMWGFSSFTQIGRCEHSHGAPPLQWRHNNHDGVSNHQPHNSLLNRLFRRRSKKTSKLCVTGLCAGNSTGTGEFPAQMASYADVIMVRSRKCDTQMLLPHSQNAKNNEHILHMIHVLWLHELMSMYHRITMGRSQVSHIIAL